ncbi:MAG: toll/interleukin-1 receptor domain-containing protein [Burkholderiaceae bacterium]
MSSIFISYRRDDSAPYAGRLYDRLSAHFGAGEVFMDIDQIEPGEDFVEVIERKVGGCETAVVLIGPRWLGIADEQGARRLDDAADFVRLEVAAALQRGVRVVPVLVGGANMPRAEQLPAPLAVLARRNAVELSDSRFHRDVDRLIAALAKPAPARADGFAKADASAVQRVGERAADAPVPSRRTAPLATPLQAFVIAAALSGAAVAAWQFIGRAPEPAARADKAVVAAPPAAVEPTVAASASIENLLHPQRAVGDTLQAKVREASRRAAHAGSADAQFAFAVENECSDPKDAQEAQRWYRLAAAQGHAGAKAALAALDAPPADEAGSRVNRSLRRDLACLAEMQKQSSEALDRMNEQARGAIRSIKAD